MYQLQNRSSPTAPPRTVTSPSPSHARSNVDSCHQEDMTAERRVSGADMSYIFREYSGRLKLYYWETAQNQKVCDDAMQFLDELTIYDGCEPSLVIGYIALVREVYSHACANLKQMDIGEEERKRRMFYQWQQIERHFSKVKHIIKKFWPIGNERDLLTIYLTLALLYSLYKDVCDEEVIKECYEASQRARNCGKYKLSRYEFSEVQQYCETIENIFFLRNQRIHNGHSEFIGNNKQQDAATQPVQSADHNDPLWSSSHSAVLYQRPMDGKAILAEYGKMTYRDNTKLSKAIQRARAYAAAVKVLTNAKGSTFSSGTIPTDHLPSPISPSSTPSSLVLPVQPTQAKESKKIMISESENDDECIKQLVNNIAETVTYEVKNAKQPTDNRVAKENGEVISGTDKKASAKLTDEKRVSDVKGSAESALSNESSASKRINLSPSSVTTSNRTDRDNFNVNANENLLLVTETTTIETFETREPIEKVDIRLETASKARRKALRRKEELEEEQNKSDEQQDQAHSTIAQTAAENLEENFTEQRYSFGAIQEAPENSANEESSSGARFVPLPQDLLMAKSALRHVSDTAKESTTDSIVDGSSGATYTKETLLGNVKRELENRTAKLVTSDDDDGDDSSAAVLMPFFDPRLEFEKRIKLKKTSIKAFNLPVIVKDINDPTHHTHFRDMYSSRTIRESAQQTASDKSSGLDAIKQDDKSVPDSDGYYDSVNC